MGIAGVVAYGLLLVLLPATPGGADAAVPAELVWEFRVRSLGGLALLWLGLGLGLGWLLDGRASAHRPDLRDALSMAAKRVELAPGAVFHSDRGTQYCIAWKRSL